MVVTPGRIGCLNVQWQTKKGSTCPRVKICKAWAFSWSRTSR
jgi:hypothetical protein